LQYKRGRAKRDLTNRARAGTAAAAKKSVLGDKVDNYRQQKERKGDTLVVQWFQDGTKSLHVNT